MRTEQIHIEKLVKLCARKNTIQLKVENIENANNTHIKQTKTIVLLNVSKFCHNGAQGSLWKGKLLDFRLVETFFENIKAFRSYDQFNTTT